jgi:adenylosuccinate synthase
MPEKAIEFVDGVESSIGTKVDYLGFGPSSLVARRQIDLGES